MKKLVSIMLTFSLILVSSALPRPLKSAKRGLGFEVGAGVSNLFWSGYSNIMTPGGAPVNRTRFTINPNVRINYSVPITEKALVLPFLGYNKMGGNGDDDKYTINTIEAGIYALHSFSRLSFGIGGKINSHLNVQYHCEYWRIHEERSEWFTKVSYGSGARITYNIAPITIGLEAWKGLSNLASGPIDTGRTKIRNDQYRLFIGYTIQ